MLRANKPKSNTDGKPMTAICVMIAKRRQTPPHDGTEGYPDYSVASQDGDRRKTYFEQRAYNKQRLNNLYVDWGAINNCFMGVPNLEHCNASLC